MANTQMQAAPAAIQTFQQALQRAAPAIQRALPRHVDVERFTRIALSCVNRTPALLECSHTSILRGIMQAAQLGLEIGSPLGEAYLVPFKKAATLIIGYGGLVELATRTGRVTSVEARAVHERDHFKFRHGTDQALEHVPYLGDDDPGHTVAVYALARLKDGEPKFEVMSVAEVDRIRAMSKQAEGDTWTLHWDQMAAKTVVRRLSKLLPKSAEMARAIALDAAAERGETQDDDETGLDFGTTLGSPPEAQKAAQPSGAPARIAQKLKTATKRTASTNGNAPGRQEVATKPEGGAVAPPPDAREPGDDDEPPLDEESSANAEPGGAPPPPKPIDRATVIERCRAIIEDRKFGEAATIRAVIKDADIDQLGGCSDDNLRAVARTLARYDASGELAGLIAEN